MFREDGIAELVFETLAALDPRAPSQMPRAFRCPNGALADLVEVFNGRPLYDPVKDLGPIASIAANFISIAVHPSVPAQNLKEFIVWLRANPDKASKGTSGVGSAIHVAGVFLQKETGTRFQFVPYRGAAPAMQDLAAGQIDFMIDLAANALPHVRAGSIKAYAVTDNGRLPSAQEIPTVDEAGVPGLHVSTWFGLWGTKGTPKAVITKLNAALVEALADPVVRKRFADLGQEMFPAEHQTPHALSDFHKAEIEKWWPSSKRRGSRQSESIQPVGAVRIACFSAVG